MGKSKKCFVIAHGVRRETYSMIFDSIAQAKEAYRFYKRPITIVTEPELVAFREKSIEKIKANIITGKPIN